MQFGIDDIEFLVNLQHQICDAAAASKAKGLLSTAARGIPVVKEKPEHVLHFLVAAPPLFTVAPVKRFIHQIQQAKGSHLFISDFREVGEQDRHDHGLVGRLRGSVPQMTQRRRIFRHIIMLRPIDHPIKIHQNRIIADDSGIIEDSLFLRQCSGGFLFFPGIFQSAAQSGKAQPEYLRPVR